MTRLPRLQAAQERVPQQGEVADGVEDLVTDELVGEPELVVEDPGLSDDHCVLEASPEGEAALAQHLEK